MPPKRKRASSPTIPSKRIKTPGRPRGRPRKSTRSESGTPGSVIQHPHGDVDTEQLYRVRSIIDEDAKRYKIDWEDGPDGEQYSPTWEPKENANDLAVAEWKHLKSEKKKRERRLSAVPPDTAPPDIPSSEPPSKKRQRPQEGLSRGLGEEAPKKAKGRPGRQSAQLRLSELGEAAQSIEHSSAQFDRQEQQSQEDERTEGAGVAAEVLQEELLLEVQDSYPEQGGFSAEDAVPTEKAKLCVLPSTREYLVASPEVRISPHPEVHERLDDDSIFPSSQAISGTQPRVSASPEPEPSQYLVDAAAAANLTQKHSQYEPEDDSASEEDTGSVFINSSSSVHTFATPHQFPVGAIIPDSQSINDSVSYIPSQNRSGQSDQITQSQIQSQTAAGSQQVIHTDSQIIPESSVPQGTQPPDVVNTLHHNTTQIEEDEGLPALISEPFSPVEAVVDQVEAAESAASPASAVAARTSSSTSSPPPTDSPGKTQSHSESQSQLQLQSQLSQPQNSPRNQQGVEQAAQRRETIEFDTTTSTILEEATPAKTSNAGIDTNQNATQAASLPLSELESLSSQQQRETRPSIQSAEVIPVTNPAVQQIVEREDSSIPAIEPTLLSPQLEGTSSISDVLQHQAPTGLNYIQSLGLSVINSLPTTSPFPSAPSQDQGRIGESAPPLPTGLTDIGWTIASGERASSMESSPSVSKIRAKLSVKERLVAARAARNAKSGITSTPRSPLPVSPKPASAVPARLQSPSLQDREARSPSMIPAIEAPAKEAPEEYLRSERYETLLPGDELEIQTTFEPLDTAPKTVNLHSIRYVPITFGVQQRDHYKQNVAYHRKLIDEFTSKVWPADSVIADKARSVVQELRNIVLHPDLNNEETHTQPSQVDPEFKAQWDVDTSTKFRFLKYYLQAAQDYNLHTVLLVKPGRIVSMLQIFLQGNNVDFRIAPNVGGGPKPAITILAPGHEAVGIYTPDLILSMQGDIPDTYTTEIQKLLQTDTAIPAVSLVVPRTVEHIERAIPNDMLEAERLHVLLGTIIAHRSEAGRERDITNTAEIAASRLVNFVLSPLDWPFGDFPDVRLTEPITSSQASTESRMDDSNDISLDNHQHGQNSKRALDMGAEEQQDAKKARIQSSSEHALNASHVSDSVASQQAAAVKLLRDEFAQKETEMDLALRQSQAQLQEHIKALETLQYQHEDQRQQLMQAEFERDREAKAASVLMLRITTLEKKAEDFRTERSDLHAKLQELRETILSNASPERAEFETLKEAAAAATAEHTKLLNKVKYAEDQLDYIRDQYQTASNQAVTLGKANTALEAQVLDLGRKASGEQSRAREMFLDTHSKNLFSRNKQLESMLRSREELLQKKEEEISRLKESSRGRINTRQSSVPRTPRIGSPLAQGTASRQGSPAAGIRPHPLRNVG